MSTWHLVLRAQQGLATRRQLMQGGLGRRELERLVASGELVRERVGLYRDRPLPRQGEHLLSGGIPDEGYVAQVRAELLHRGDGARAARLTAAVLWGFDMQVEPTRICLDLPHGASCAGHLDIRTSRRDDAVLWAALPGAAPLRVTPPVTTVLDCAAALPLAQAVTIVDSALRRRRCSLRALQEGVRRRRGTAGAEHLWNVLRWCDPKSGSVLESLLRVLLALAGLPLPKTQVVLTDPLTGRVQRVDFAWPQHRLVVECDGRRWHDPSDARDADRRRDNTCAILGWTVLRFTWAEVVHQPDAVIAAVRAALAAHAAA